MIIDDVRHVSYTWVVSLGSAETEVPELEVVKIDRESSTGEGQRRLLHPLRPLHPQRTL
jgi:hypothetical protein